MNATLAPALPRRRRRGPLIALTAVILTASVGLLGWVQSMAVAGDLLVNGSFDTGTSGAGWSTTDPVGVEVWTLGGTHQLAWTNWDAGSPSTGYDGPNFAEINASSAGTLYQDVTTNPGDVLTWKLAHRARAGNSGSDVMKVLAGPGGGSGATGLTALTPTKKNGVTLNSPGVTLSDTGAAWGVWEGEYIVPAGQTSTRFAFQAVSSANGNPSYGNFLDGIQFGSLSSGVVLTASSPSSITVSDPLPTIGYSSNPSTTSGDWSTQPTCAVYATSDSSYATPLSAPLAAGTYATYCSGGASASYHVSSRVAGSLTVTKVPVTVTASSPSTLTAGSAVPAITYTTSPTSQASDWTTQPTCGVYASTDVTYANPLTGTLTAGTYVTRCSGGTSSSYNPTSYVNGTLVVSAPAPTSSSGGGASPPLTSTSTEAPAPVVVPSPSPSVDASSNLDPIQNRENGSVPAGGVPVGQSVLLVNGVPTGVRVVPNAPSGATGLDVSGDGFFMRISGRGGDGDPLGLGGQAQLVLQSLQSIARSSVSGQGAACVVGRPLAESSGSGFKAGTQVKLYLLPGTLLGTFAVDGSGEYSGSVPVPVGLPLGGQTLQANGYAPSGAVRSVSLGVQVVPVKQSVSRKASAQVFFAPNSPVISAQGKRALNALARRAGTSGQGTVVVGFVQQTSSTSNDQSLSTQRARNVAAYLKSKGVKGAYQVRGDGVAGPGNDARRVNITITYQPGC